jgi:hypothetical protein
LIRSIRAPFPQPNSWGLVEQDGEMRPVRILNLVGDEASISFAGVFVASGARRVPLAQILNADPLSDAEQAELDALDTAMAGKARPKKAVVARAEALGLREQRARSLKALLDKVPEKYFMSPATLIDMPLPAAPHPGWGLIVDNFAGGGGASTGIEAALGRDVDIAINHDAEAVAMHAANHPGTKHLCQSIYAVDPLEAVADEHGVPQPVLGAWFSPDCKHFSKAKGGKPVEKNIRDLAMVVPHWVERLGPRLRPQVIWLENVEEFRTWGPLGADNKPCPKRKGETFDAMGRPPPRAGYKVEWRELRACDYGAPTSRKRLF